MRPRDTLPPLDHLADYWAARRLPDGRYLALMPLLLGRWRLILGRLDDPVEYDDGY